MFVIRRLNLTISCISTVSNDVSKPLSWITKVVGPFIIFIQQRGHPLLSVVDDVNHDLVRGLPAAPTAFARLQS